MITAPATLLLGVFSSTSNFYIRVAEIGLLVSIVMLSVSFSRKNNEVLLPLISFFLIYSVRLVNDVLLEDILMIYQTPLYTLGYFLGLTLLPVITIALLYRSQDSQIVFRHSLAVLIVGNICLFLYAVTAGHFENGSIFSGRIQKSGELEGTATLGPIWIGMSGAMLASMLIGLFVSRRWYSKIQLGVGTALLCLSVTNIFFGASRGPLIALVVVIMALLFRPRTRVVGAICGASRRKAWMIAIWTVCIAALLIVSSEGTVFLVERMFSLYTDYIDGREVFEARSIIYAAAWQDFLTSPLIGTSYVVSHENSSAHNIILESLMATGLVGTIVLFMALIRALKGILRLMDGTHGSEGVSLALLAICSLVTGLSSSSIGQSPALWILLALVTVMGTSDISLREHVVFKGEYSNGKA